MTNLEGRVLLRRAAVAPPAGCASDLEIIAGLAERLGAPSGVLDRPGRGLRRAAPGQRGRVGRLLGHHLRADRRGERRCSGPARPTDHPGTPRMFLDRFATPDGRARFVPVEHRPAADDLRRGRTRCYLTTGRVLAHYQSGAQTRRVPRWPTRRPEPFVEIHPRPGRAAGRRRRATGRGRPAGAARRCAPARVTATIRPDTVFMPFHWAGPARSTSHQPGARPDLADAGVQGLRR